MNIPDILKDGVESPWSALGEIYAGETKICEVINIYSNGLFTPAHKMEALTQFIADAINEKVERIKTGGNNDTQG